MGLFFRGIRMRLQLRLEMFSLQMRRAGLKVLQRGLVILSKQDKTVIAAIEANNQEFDAKSTFVQQEALFTAVGRALSLTSHTDENLVAITGMLLRTKFQMAGVVMYSIINFHVRLNIIDELFSISPHYGSLKPKWNNINEKLRAMQDTRDRLAHHTLYSSVTNDSVALNPGRLDTRRKSQKYKPLDFP